MTKTLIASVKDQVTKEITLITSTEFATKAEFKASLKGGYTVRFITTEENFDADVEKFYAQQEKNKVAAQIKRDAKKETARMIKEIEEKVAAEKEVAEFDATIVIEEVAQVIEVVETATIEIAEVETTNAPDQVSTFHTVEAVKEINNYMSIKEACYRWGIQETRLREKLNIKRRPSLQNDLDEGRVKYFKVDGMQRGEWTITTRAMMMWYGDEKRE